MGRQEFSCEIRAEGILWRENDAHQIDIEKGCQMADKNEFMVLIKSPGFGEGEPDLGEKLMQSFMQMLLEADSIPDRMVFMNTGIFLTTEGSALVDLIRKFADKETEVLTCSTCLAYYNRESKLAVGQTTNMKDTVGALLNYRRVITI